MRPASLLAALVFSIVALSHLARLVLQVEVVIGGAVIPMWVSALGVIVAAGIATALWREGQSPDPSERPA